MSIRIEVQQDGSIEILRSWITDAATKWLRYPPGERERAKRTVSYLIDREARRVAGECFVPQLDRECRRLLKREIATRKGNGHL